MPGRWAVVATVAGALTVAVGGIVVFAGGGDKGAPDKGATPTTAASATGRSSGSTGGGDDCKQPNDSPAPEVPANDKAAIFDNFGSSDGDTKLLDEIDASLSAEGYDVDRFTNSQGATGIDNATLDNFVGMAKDCIVVIDTSGLRSGGTDALLLVESWQSETAANDSYTSLSTSKKYTSDEITVSCADGAQTNASCTSWGVFLTQKGVADFFGNKGVALVDAMACGSMSFAPSFGASAFFGYDSTCSMSSDRHEAVDDSRRLFAGLTGKLGVGNRTTTAAATQQFSNGFGIASKDHPIVLAPAVRSISPTNESKVDPGETTSVTVKFDAKVDTSGPAEDAIDADDNCGSVENAKWSADGTTLTFDYVVPAKPTGERATVTIVSDKVIGGSGFGNELDGNTNPSGTDGQPGNGDGYVVTYTCAAGIDLFVSGQVDGQAVEGQIGSSAQITCIPPPDERNTAIVHWNGFPDKTKNSVAGEFDLKYGTWTDPLTSQGTASFQVNNPKLERLGWSGGTITVSASGGSVDADFANGPGSVHVRGTWTCPS